MSRAKFRELDAAIHAARQAGEALAGHPLLRLLAVQCHGGVDCDRVIRRRALAIEQRAAARASR